MERSNRGCSSLSSAPSARAWRLALPTLLAAEHTDDLFACAMSGGVRFARVLAFVWVTGSALTSDCSCGILPVVVGRSGVAGGLAPREMSEAGGQGPSPMRPA